MAAKGSPVSVAVRLTIHWIDCSVCGVSPASLGGSGATCGSSTGRSSPKATLSAKLVGELSAETGGSILARSRSPREVSTGPSVIMR
jgi:hypothetical protein